MSQLERLNAEASARTKRERRRANEVKQRTIQRMQLQMTAPLDIGLEQTDATLSLGQDDVFDLDNAAKALERRGGAARLAEADDAESDEEEEADDFDDDVVLDAAEEEERKVANLEAQLDGLYDMYRDHLRERDAKYKVKEARKNAKHREEWGGIKEKGSDDESDESDEEGGYHKFEEAKERAGADSSSEDESSDEEDAEAPRVAAKKRRIAGDAPAEAPSRKKARFAAELAPASGPLSRAAQVWFSQDCFAGAGIDVSDGEVEEDEEEESGVNGDVVPDGDVQMEVGCSLFLYALVR